MKENRFRWFGHVIRKKGSRVIRMIIEVCVKEKKEEGQDVVECN